jgi:drug/metabolite transporter (DMT)-like permease
MTRSGGYAAILAAAFFWGISATTAKVLMAGDVDTLLIVQSRVTITFLLLAAGFLLLRPAWLRVRPADLWRFALVGVAGVAGANVTYYITIRESTVATAILLQYTAPLLVMGYATVTGAERLTGRRITAALLSLLGCFLAVGGVGGGALRSSPLGIAMGIASAFCFAFLNVGSARLLTRYPFQTVTVYTVGFAALFWLVVNPGRGLVAEPPGLPLLGALTLFAVISILIPHSLFFSGLRTVPPSRAIITSTLEPVVAILSAALIVGELLGPVQVLGALAVIAAIVLLNTGRDAHPAAGEHP